MIEWARNRRRWRGDSFTSLLFVSYRISGTAAFLLCPVSLIPDNHSISGTSRTGLLCPHHKNGVALDKGYLQSLESGMPSSRLYVYAPVRYSENSKPIKSDTNGPPFTKIKTVISVNVKSIYSYYL